MKALDLFCGLGGWSDGLSEAGFDVLGVEIREDLARLYKHPVIIADVRDLDAKRFKGFDLIIGSPPCRDFSAQTFCAFRKGNPWKIPPDPNGRGLELVNTFLNFVEIAEPKYWLMENVARLSRFLGRPYQMKVKIAGGKNRCFWGDFPLFLIPYHPHIKMHYTGKFRSELNAYIPPAIGKSLGEAISRA